MGSLRSDATGIHITPAKLHQALLEDEINHWFPPQVQDPCWNFMAWAVGSHLLISSLSASLYLCIPVGTWSFWLHISTHKQRLWTTVSSCSRSHQRCGHHCRNSFKGKVTLGKD